MRINASRQTFHVRHSCLPGAFSYRLCKQVSGQQSGDELRGKESYLHGRWWSRSAWNKQSQQSPRAPGRQRSGSGPSQNEWQDRGHLMRTVHEENGPDKSR